MKISKNSVASIDYTLTDNEGEIIDTSKDRGPLAYIQGVGNLIPGLEKELEGKEAGDSLQVSVPPEEGYGARDDSLMDVVASSVFQGVESLEVGMQFQAKTEQGNQVISIVAIDGDDVTVDANHPLAGETLNFDVKVVEVRDATEEELQHGHAHGPHGIDH